MKVIYQKLWVISCLHQILVCDSCACKLKKGMSFVFGEKKEDYPDFGVLLCLYKKSLQGVFCLNPVFYNQRLFPMIIGNLLIQL